MPFTSSKSRNVRKNSRRRSIMAASWSVSSCSPWPPRGLHQAADQYQPDDCQRDKHFPPQPHELIVPVSQESREKPQETDKKESDLQQQPGQPARRQPGQADRV